jgi:MtN3 and saliva related transmembrane protein
LNQEVITEVIGWASSTILLLTISKQIYKQWQEQSSEGVSKWLFIGQVAASLGFTVYSWLLSNWVFVVTNALMFISAFVGLGIVLYHQRRDARSEKQTEISSAKLDEVTYP